MGGSSRKGSPADTINGLQLGTSCYGKPVPLVYGTTRIGGNVVWMPNELWSKVAGGSGGKGGGGSAPGQDQYYQGLILAICEGPIVGLGRIWRDKDVYTALSQVETGHPFSLYLGTRPQTSWPYLTTPWSDKGSISNPTTVAHAYTITDPWFNGVTNVYISGSGGGGMLKKVAGVPATSGEYQVTGNVVLFHTSINLPMSGNVRVTINWARLRDYTSQASGYGGTAYIATESLALGSSNTLKNITYEVQGLLSAGGDVNPADVLADYLGSPEHGHGWSSAQYEVDRGQDGTQASGLRRYAAQAGFLISPAFTEQRPSLENIKSIADSVNAGIVWSEDRLKVLPLGDTAVGTYAPAITPLFDLTRDHFVAGATEPAITFTRKSEADTFNSVPVEYLDKNTTDPGGAYNVAVEEVVDQASADATGLRKSDAVSLHHITDKAVAQKISRIRSQRSLYNRTVFSFKLQWKFGLVEPLDFVRISDDISGVTNQLVRIKTIEEDDNCDLAVEAEEWNTGVASATAFTTQTGDGGGQNVQVVPTDAMPPIILLPPLLDGESPHLLVGTSGTTKDWGGAQVWVSWDGTTYALMGDIGAARYGVLGLDLAAGAAIDATNAIRVDCRATGTTFANDPDRDSLTHRYLVGDELICYNTAALVSAGVYDLTNLIRGVSGTGSKAHTAGTPVVELNSALLSIPIDSRRAAGTVYIKLVSYNLADRAYQDSANAPVYSYTLPSSATVVSIQNVPVRMAWDRFNRDEWDLVNNGGGSLTVVPAAGVAGGTILRAAGTTWWVHRALVPFDPNRTYQVLARLRQYAEPTVGGKNIYFGLVGVAADGVTLVNASGAAGSGGQHYITSLPGAGWTEILGYWSGTAAAGTAGGPLSAPGKLHSNVRYVRLLMYFNESAGNGTQDVDSLQLVEADPTSVTAYGTAVTAQVAADAASILANNAAVKDLSNVIGGSVSAALIANNAVTQDKIKAGSILAKHLVLTNFDNLIPNPACAATEPDGVSAWQAGSWEASGLALLGIGPTTYVRRLNVSVLSTDYFLELAEFTVLPGDKLHFESRGYQNPSTIKTALGFRFYDSAGGLLSTLLGTYQTGILGDQAYIPTDVTVPASAVTCRPLLTARADSGATGFTSLYGLYCRRMAGSELIVDGAIVASKIQAGAVYAGHMVVANYDNLIPNANSLITTAPSGDITVAGLNNFGGTAFSDNGYYRQLVDNGAGATQVGLVVASMPCNPGEWFYFSAQSGKQALGGTQYACIRFLNAANGQIINVLSATGVSAAAMSGTLLEATAQAPAGTAKVVFCFVGNAAAGTAYFNRMYARRMAGAELIVDGSITTGKLFAGSVTPAKLAAGAVTANEVAARAITADRLTVGSGSANLYPNATSEAAPPTGADVTTPEWSGRFNAGAGAYAGAYVRRLVSVTQYTESPSLVVPCLPGDTFYFACWHKYTVRTVASRPYLYARFFDSTGTMIQDNIVFDSSPLTTYRLLEVNTVAAPAAAVEVRCAYGLDSTVANTAGETFYYDALTLAKRVPGSLIVDGSLTAAKIAAGEIKTSNYAEDGSGNPTAGAKLDHQGTAFKAASADIRINKRSMPQMFGVMAASNWLTFTSLAAGQWNAVAENSTTGRLVAVGLANLCATSDNQGRTWVARTIPAGGYMHVTYGNGLFVAVGNANVCATSPDGITWTARTIGTGNWTRVRYNGARWVAVASTGQYAWSTSPTTSWTTGALPANNGSTNYGGLAWSPTVSGGLWVASSWYGCSTSPDGSTWTARGTAGTNGYTFVDVVWAPELGLYIATGNSSRAWTSPDGINWTVRTTGISNMSAWSIAWSGLTLVIAGYDSTNLNDILAISSDGINWTMQDSSLNANLYGITWCVGAQAAAGYFYVVGKTNGVAGDPLSMRSLIFKP